MEIEYLHYMYVFQLLSIFKINFRLLLLVIFLFYIRRLRYFSDRNPICPMVYFIEAYLNQFASLYSRCYELISTHALIHLFEQALNLGSFSSHSLFSTESYLHHL
jgi:hypothetical protein